MQVVLNPRKLQLDWGNFGFLLVTHVGALATLLWAIGPERSFAWQSWALAISWLVLCNLSIVGMHRYYAHKSHKALLPVKILYLLFGAGSFQGPAMRWASLHRDHHAFSDTHNDPYSVTRGFWWAHILWVIFKAGPKDSQVPIGDLQRDKLVLWQKRYYLPLAFFMGFVLPALIALSWGDPWGGFLLAGLVRLTVQWHQTFCVNSVAHWFGEVVGGAGTAKNFGFWLGLLVALLTFGEGARHGRHHKKPRDYRIDPTWWGLDPGKWFIWTMSKIGFTSSLVRQD